MKRWGRGPERPTAWETELAALVGFLEEQVGDLRTFVRITPEAVTPNLRARVATITTDLMKVLEV